MTSGAMVQQEKGLAIMAINSSVELVGVGEAVHVASMWACGHMGIYLAVYLGIWT